MICKVCQVLVMISFMVFPHSVAGWAIQAEYSGAGSLFSEGWSLKRDFYGPISIPAGPSGLSSCQPLSQFIKQHLILLESSDIMQTSDGG